MISKKTLISSKIFKIYLLFGVISLFWTIWFTLNDIIFPGTNHVIIAPPGESINFNDPAYIGTYTKYFTTFVYFTFISNFLFSLFTCIRSFKRNKFFSNNIQIMLATYMVITSIILWLGLFYLATALSYSLPWKAIFLDYKQMFMHLFNPLMSLIIVIFFLDKKEPIIDIDKKKIYKLLILPGIYYIFLWILYLSISGKASVYPFSDFYNPLINTSNIFVIIIMNLIILLGLIILIITLYIWFNILAFKRQKISIPI